MGLLTVVRHGQASFLQADYDKLSPLGEEQARKLAAYWLESGARFDRVYYGPALRQRRTGEIVAEAMRDTGVPWPEARVDDDFDEYAGIEVMKRALPRLCETDVEIGSLHRDFREARAGPLAGRTFEKMFQRVMRLWVAGELPCDDIECWCGFCERIARAIARVRQGGGRPVVFTSGGVMAATARVALDLSPLHTMELSWMPRNASYSEFLFSGERFSLSSFNAHPHLDAPELLTWR